MDVNHECQPCWALLACCSQALRATATLHVLLEQGCDLCPSLVWHQHLGSLPGPGLSQRTDQTSSPPLLHLSPSWHRGHTARSLHPQGSLASSSNPATSFRHPFPGCCDTAETGRGGLWWLDRVMALLLRYGWHLSDCEQHQGASFTLVVWLPALYLACHDGLAMPTWVGSSLQWNPCCQCSWHRQEDARGHHQIPFHFISV